MYNKLNSINSRPAPFQYYTADKLWTDHYTSKQMLRYHLDETVDLSSRNKGFIDRSVAWLTTRFNIGSGVSVIDFGCGPGLYTTPLAEQGASVTGVDFSSNSIAYARETASVRGLNINYVVQNYLDFETADKFDLIIMIMCDFCALSPEQRMIMLEKFRGLLADGGVVLLDVYSLNAFRQREEAAVYEHNLLDEFWSPDDYYGFQNTFKYEKEKVVLDKYTVVEASGTRTIYNWLQYFSPEALESEFNTAGLSIAEYYADVAGAPFYPAGGEYAIIAQKNE